MMSFLPNISSVAERAGVLESCRLTLIPVAPFICVKLSNLLKIYGLIFSFFVLRIKIPNLQNCNK